MGGGPDQRDPAIERLVVGPGPLEARQEPVMDIDRPALQPLEQLVEGLCT